MNAFFEHHQHNIKFRYRGFDRLLLNGCIQSFLHGARLPQFAMAYTDLGKHRLIAQHAFSNFRLFSIATGQVMERTETSQPRER
jgi:hypothetical protein